MSAINTDKDGNLKVQGDIQLAAGKRIKGNGGSAGTVIAAVAGATPAGGTGATAGAYDTANNRDALIATVAEVKAQFNALLAELKTQGVVRTS